MTILQTGVSLPLNLKAGETLVIKELSGTSTVTGSVASREDASASIGAGFVVYGPQSSDCSVTISTTGVCDWVVRVGDATPTTDTIKTLKIATGQTVLDDASRMSIEASMFKRAPNLRKLYAGIAKVLSGQGQCFIGLIDDSTGVGAGAGSGGAGLIGARPGSPTAQLASLLTSMGVPASDDSWFGEHLIEAFQGVTRAQYDTRFTVSASAAYYPNGAFQSLGGIPFRLNSAGKAVNFTPTNQVNTAKIFYANRFTGGTFDTTFAGGASLGTTVAAGGNTIGSTTKSFTKGAGALSVSWVSGDNAILGAICWDTTTPRVNVVNLSCYGDKLTSSNGYANNVNADFRGGAALSSLGLDAVIVGMTINSENQDGLAGVAAYKTALTKVCNDVVASGADLIISTPHKIGTSAQTSGICDAYVAAIREVATQFNAPVIDLYQRIDDYTTFNALGLYFDTLHLTTSGYRAKAQEFARVLNVWS